MLPKQAALFHLFAEEDACLVFLREQGVFYNITACPECHGTVTLARKLYRCNRMQCGKKFSLLRGSFFAKSKLQCNEILHIGYLWLAGCSHSSITLITGHSTATITSFLSSYRKLVATALDTDDTVIGGPGIVVEIDESKFGKRKYHRGHRVEGAWVIGGVERTQERLLFAEVVQRRDANTLMEVLSRHIAAGSIVHTDLWRGYWQMDTLLNVEHRTVNHSQNFVNPVDGTHTNTIEGTWGALKFKIAPRNRTQEDIEGHLVEFIWRRKHDEDLWGGLIAALRSVYYE
jgi:transposase-like protein